MGPLAPKPPGVLLSDVRGPVERPGSQKNQPLFWDTPRKGLAFAGYPIWDGFKGQARKPPIVGFAYFETHPFRTLLACCMWVWLKIKELGLRRF